VQESVDLVSLAFDLAEKYRTISIILSDSNIGQMMEPVEMPPMQPLRTQFADWSIRGAKDRPRRFLSSIYLSPPEEEATNFRLLAREEEIKKNEVRFKEYYMEDAEYAVVGFGSAGRVAFSAVRAAREEGIKIGLFRPISLNPFPEKQLYELGKRVKALFVVEMNSGMMLKDVQLATRCQVPIEFYGRMGGMTPMPEEMLSEIHTFVKGPFTTEGDPQARWLNRAQKAQ
jgi:2-oxoglutarate ferredoxin oxidoreductase subunit alpha